MAKLRVPGRRDELVSKTKVDRVLGSKIQVSVKDAVRVAGTRAGEEVVLEGVAGDSVVEIEVEGGIRLWVSVDQMQEDLAEHGTRSAADGSLVIPGAWPASSRTRGAGAWAVTGLKILDVDLAGMGAQAIASYLEGQLEPGPGLYECPDPTQLAGRIKGPSGVDGSGPILVFVHGTASNTAGSFGGLIEDERRAVWSRIQERYGQRVYAFEHRTLTRSPVDNARELASLLPANAQVHLVSHSRGGLVCELLCQGQRVVDGSIFDDDDLRQFDDHGDQAGNSRKQLEALGGVLARKGLDVQRFVRVACPARGTTLASGRLDRFLSLGLNALGLIPALKVSQTYDFVKTLLLAVAKKRIDPSELPGLEAQTPTSPLVRVLNRQDKLVDADLSVIAGDLEGRGVWGRLKTFATDLFYREDHDLVVNTSAMYGGTPRAEGRGRFFFDQGNEVNHFKYFRNDSSVEQLELALAESGTTVGGFRPIEDAAPPREVARRSFRGAGTEPRPVVFVLPGIMGTHLKVGDDRIWADPRDLAKGGLDRLTIDSAGVEPDAVMGRSYLKLLQFLESVGHEAIPFPYDWRLSILDEGRRFAVAVDAKLAETAASGMPVRILAHSMGGLVARAMLAQRRSVWEALKERPGSRLIMLGTPNGGSYTIPRVVLAREKVLRQLALIDLRHKRRRVQEIVSGFHGLLELMPVDCGEDLYEVEVWKRLAQVDDGKWTPPTAADLKAAKRLREVLESSPIDAERMLYVAGQAPATPIGMKVDDQEGIVFLASAEGDGRVPWATGRLPDVPTWYMAGVRHGALANHKPSFSAIDELLREGGTQRLSTRSPAVRGAGETFVIREDDADQAVDVYPSRSELEAAALGDEPFTVEEELEVPILVSVAHGDLAYAPAPVIVGHYEGDLIVSAEAALDRQLDRRLTRRLRLGRYPGPIGSSEVVLDRRRGAKPGGAIVVGLGRVGELSRGALTTSFVEAILGYALKLAEERSDDSLEEIELVSLLIGSSEAGLMMEESVEAILEGVQTANSRLLAEVDSKQRLRFGSLTLVELYQDLAVQALHTLRNLGAADKGILVAEELRSLEAGRRRVFNQPDPRWWLRLVIQEEVVPAVPEAGAESLPCDGPAPVIEQLRFSLLGDRARAETTPLAISRNLVDGMIEDAMHTLRDDPQVGKTLFEMLLPNHLKVSAAERRHLVLVVDERAARYPWELLVNRAAGDVALSRRAGLVRQLSTTEYRPQVVTPTKATALVIGDPPSDLAELPGAQDEAMAVIELLESGGFEIPNRKNAIRPSTAQVLNALLTDDYRVVHLAGHGDFDPSDKNRSGMVIGKGRFLTPAVINQMTQVPELVFINCCHLGYIAGEDGEVQREEPRAFHRLAANLGAQLIRMGVRAVVAAGWPVDDAAALTFATTFYNGMLGGEEFGKAVLDARVETHRAHGNTNTWGAYQCYGDPSYRLVRRTRRDDDDEHFPYVAADELIVTLDNSVSSARAGGPGWGSYLNWLENHPRFPKGWRQTAAVATAFGRAFAEIREYERAVRYYRLATELEHGAMTLRDIEQLGNVEVRWGERSKDVDIVRSGLARLRQVLELGPTSERWSLVGGSCKRLAQLSSGKDRLEALEQMSAAYQEAHELTLRRTGQVDTYPLLNYLAARVVRRLKDDTLDDLAELLEAAEEAAPGRFAAKPDFWNAIIPADIALVRHLASGKLRQPAKRREVVESYLAGRTRAASQREFDSVIDHVRFLIAMRSDGSLTRGRSESAKRARADVEGLEQLLEALQSENRD